MNIHCFFSDNSAYYFFSSLLQANAAILSIVGVFYIFRIQSLSSSIDVAKTALSQNPAKFTTPARIAAFDDENLEGKKHELEQMKNNEAGNLILPFFGLWVKSEIEIDRLKNKARLPTILLAASLIIFTAGLLLAAYLHSLPFPVEFLTLLILSLLESALVAHIAWTILELMKQPTKRPTEQPT